METIQEIEASIGRMDEYLASYIPDTDRRLKSKTFIDLFAGCGGISLGLMQAGWKGLFAVEKDKFAFQTLEFNLINGKNGF